MAEPQSDTAPPLRAEAIVTGHEDRGGPNRWLECAVPGWPIGLPGQFLMISPGPLGGAPRTDPLLPRPMAVFRQRPCPDDPGSTRVEILYKAEGRGTRLLADAVPGDRVTIVGPLGRSFPPIAAGQTAVLVGGGTGVASLFELAQWAAQDASVHVLLGARSATDLMGHAEFGSLEGVDVAVATEDGSLGTRGRVTALLEPWLEAAGSAASRGRDTVVYACGPTPMMAACARLCAEAGVRCLVSLENHMACGFGVCLGCAAPTDAEGYALVCRAGPVFDAATVRWEEMP